MGRVYTCAHTLIRPEKKGGLTFGTGDKNREDRNYGKGLIGDDVLDVAKSSLLIPIPQGQSRVCLPISLQLTHTHSLTLELSGSVSPDPETP